ncbi:MAG: hypothetical protein F2667_10480 [Actinobacteria bacterium]|uniref:Unannotated protein n=1 Tax=freshwater metagenome TaxID=449393 RepID=A0A6J6RE95_9ZZZZ|nr:hypothetical protein [Actinomycetota bacterium]
MPGPLSRISLTAAALAVLVAGLASGCAKENDEPSEPSPAPAPAVSSPAATSDPALRLAAQGYLDALLGGDAATAYAMLTRRCQDHYPEESFATIVAGAAQVYGTPLPFLTYADEVTGRTALITYTVEESVLDQVDQPWAYEQGSWHSDDC